MQQYTLEELAYEYFLVKHLHEAQQEQADAEADRIEEEKWREAEAWADEMERLEEEERQRKAQKDKKKSNDATDELKPLSNEEWMKKHMEEAKAIYGETFGEDLSISFDDKDE